MKRCHGPRALGISSRWAMGDVLALRQSGADSTIEAISTVGCWWWADPVGVLAMLAVALWQRAETLTEARAE
jgi:hypothetical protein